MANLLNKLFKGFSVEEIPDVLKELAKADPTAPVPSGNFSGIQRPAEPAAPSPYQPNFTGVTNAAGNANNPVINMGTPQPQAPLFRGLVPQSASTPYADQGLQRPDQQPGYAPLTGPGFTTPAAPAPVDPFNPPAQPTQPYQRPSDQTYGKIQDIENTYANGEDPHGRHSLLQRLFGGMGKAWQQWDGQGGLVGLATSMLSGGIGSAKDPKNYAELEKRGLEQKLFRRLGIEQQREAYDATEGFKQAQTANQYNQIGNRNLQTSLDIAKADRDKLNAEQKNLIDIWKASDTYKRGQDPEFDKRLEKAGVHVLDKEPGKHYTGSYGPDGTFNVLETGSGISETRGNFAKAKEYSSADLDNLRTQLGVPSEKEIGDRALASVGKLPEGREINTDVTTKLPQFIAPDGSFDEAKYWKAYSNNDTDVKPSDVYKKLPDSYDQQVAKARNAVRQSYANTEKAIAQFATAINHRTPNPNNPPRTYADVERAFKAALKNPKDLAAFFKALPYVNIK